MFPLTHPAILFIQILVVTIFANDKRFGLDYTLQKRRQQRKWKGKLWAASFPLSMGLHVMWLPQHVSFHRAYSRYVATDIFRTWITVHFDLASLHALQLICSCLLVKTSILQDTFFFFCLVALLPNAGHGLLIHEVFRSHNDAPQSVGLLWTSAQLVAETSTWQHSQ
jgi:hypothetical protein